MNVAQAPVRNVGTCPPMLRENSKRRTHKDESTDAECRGGIARSSNEASVMEVERRGRVIQFWKMVNRKEGTNGQNKVVRNLQAYSAGGVPTSKSE